jgi:hypothetical protein
MEGILKTYVWYVDIFAVLVINVNLLPYGFYSSYDHRI